MKTPVPTAAAHPMVKPNANGASVLELEAKIAEATKLHQQGKEQVSDGDIEGGVELLEHALALMAGHSVPLVADLMYRLGVVRARRGETAEADRIFQQSLEVAAWCNDTAGQAYAVNSLAAMAQRRGDLELAESQYRRAVRLANEASEYRLVGMVEQNLGVMASIRGDLDSAEIHYNLSLDAFERTGDGQGVCWVLNNLGKLQTDLGRFGEAQTTLTRGLKLARERKDQATEGLFELNRVEAYIGGGKMWRARRGCGRVLSIAKQRGDGLLRAEGLKLRAILDRGRRRPQPALKDLEEARGLAVEGEDALLVAEILREVGACWQDLGEVARARAVWRDALERFDTLDATLDAADVRGCLEKLGGEG